MKLLKKELLIFFSIFTLLMGAMLYFETLPVNAASVERIFDYEWELVIGTKGKIDSPTSGKHTFKSMNKNIATVSSKGVVKAKKLGVAKIVVKSKTGGKEVYYITVMPENISDIWIDNRICIKGQEYKLEPKSDKYDLSAIKWKYSAAENAISKTGKYISKEGGIDTITFEYGTYSNVTKFRSYDADDIWSILQNPDLFNINEQFKL